MEFEKEIQVRFINFGLNCKKHPKKINYAKDVFPDGEYNLIDDEYFFVVTDNLYFNFHIADYIIFKTAVERAFKKRMKNKKVKIMSKLSEVDKIDLFSMASVIFCKICNDLTKVEI